MTQKGVLYVGSWLFVAPSLFHGRRRCWCFRCAKLAGSARLAQRPRARMQGGTDAADAAAPVQTRVPLLLGVAKDMRKPPRLRLDALDELSSVLVAGRCDSELSTAVVTAGW